MEKYISCWNVTGRCYYVVRADTEEEALRRLGEHTESAHQIPLSEELRQRARMEANREAA